MAQSLVVNYLADITNRKIPLKAVRLEAVQRMKISFEFSNW